MILIRERSGIATDARISLKLPEKCEYPGITTTREENGYTSFRVSLPAWGGVWLKKAPKK